MTCAWAERSERRAHRRGNQHLVMLFSHALWFIYSFSLQVCLVVKTVGVESDC